MNTVIFKGGKAPTRERSDHLKWLIRVKLFYGQNKIIPLSKTYFIIIIIIIGITIIGIIMYELYTGNLQLYTSTNDVSKVYKLHIFCCYNV